ncbi:hypothetical protein BDK51DRAFT_39225 [Blyttiomyces helicus]|uniref:Uncharacterized protein n=1 Tax=Blyttiomyces helicus TaxID=388810 RepID=A0A4V1IR45_9FUNG|nr:hypothetical protein BDK51DRAFT_39225 [Blyttiomyces helicus]|eukprot:RKO88777.1 hypothetical protein BDK51DRAFT_39225 [Blyttiomyces helicus]
MTYRTSVLEATPLLSRVLVAEFVARGRICELRALWSRLGAARVAVWLEGLEKPSQGLLQVPLDYTGQDSSVPTARARQDPVRKQVLPGSNRILVAASSQFFSAFSPTPILIAVPRPALQPWKLTRVLLREGSAVCRAALWRGVAPRPNMAIRCLTEVRTRYENPAATSTSGSEMVGENAPRNGCRAPAWRTQRRGGRCEPKEAAKHQAVRVASSKLARHELRGEGKGEGPRYEKPEVAGARGGCDRVGGWWWK